MKNVKLNRKGFSLIELMVVVAIIGILAAIAIPNFQRFQRKSRQAEAKGSLGSYHTALNANAAEWGCYRGNFVAIGWQPAGELYYRVVTTNNAGCMPPQGWNAANDVAACVNTAAGTCAGAPAGFVLWNERATAAAPPAPAAMTNNTYQATAAGNLGGNQDDQWRINQNKLLENLQSGL